MSKSWICSLPIEVNVHPFNAFITIFMISINTFHTSYIIFIKPWLLLGVSGCPGFLCAVVLLLLSCLKKDLVLPHPSPVEHKKRLLSLFLFPSRKTQEHGIFVIYSWWDSCGNAGRTSRFCKKVLFPGESPLAGNMVLMRLLSSE